jgi:hypothetical protein
MADISRQSVIAIKTVPRNIARLTQLRFTPFRRSRFVFGNQHDCKQVWLLCA